MKVYKAQEVLTRRGLDRLSRVPTLTNSQTSFKAQKMAIGWCVTNTFLKEEMWSCTRDEGWPLEVRSQVPASNPCKLRPSRAAVVSVAAKGGAEVPSGTIRRGERKRTADDVSKCQR